MLALNLNNIEEIIFRNKAIQGRMPEFKSYFAQWNMSRQHAYLKAIGKQAAIDLLNALNDHHITVLEKHFGMTVTIDKLNNRAINNCKFKIDEAEQELNKLNEMAQVSAYRKGDQLYISLWR